MNSKPFRLAAALSLTLLLCLPPYSERVSAMETTHTLQGFQNPAMSTLSSSPNAPSTRVFKPVWSGGLADPFVLQWKGDYYAYGTGGIQPTANDRGGHFPVLRSRDFVKWDYIGCALDPSVEGTPKGGCWAPEVVERDGTFYLYFSFPGGAGDEHHRLHVAVADNPAGPFRVVRALLPDEGFTIDGHPFQDPADGRWYLFFSKDFFEGRVGTGNAVVALADSMTAVEGPVTPVLQPFADWQIFERNRTIYGRQWEAWHTIEGSFVVYRNGKYYLFYSGGPWHSENYGVGCAVADRVRGPYRFDADLEGPSVLRTLPGRLIGPGHNSIVVGPDGKTDYIVHHAWNAKRTKRQMMIQPLRWTPEGPRVAD